MLIVFLSARISPFTSTVILRERSPRATAVAELLTAAGIPTRAAAAVAPLVWSKLLANAPINPLGSLLRCTNGAVVANPFADELLARLVAETAARATAGRRPASG